MKKSLVDIQDRYMQLGIGSLPKQITAKALYQAGHMPVITSEKGYRATPAAMLQYMQQIFSVDYGLRATIMDIRTMDRVDPRVKKIHRRIGRDAIKGGLILRNESSPRIQSLWNDFSRRMQFNRPSKLESDARGLAMEGNLALQWVFDDQNNMLAAIRMPSETIKPKVAATGVFSDPGQAYIQVDINSGKIVATFALWQMSLERLTPDNYDDKGCMGRPYLDANRTIWKKLTMTEEDLVIRRKTRAQQRKVHQLKNVSDDAYEKYKANIENDKYDQTADYVIRGEGSVTALSGDTNLEQIADIVHLLDTFFSGSPGSKGLFGYPDGLNRDILEDLKRDYYEEIDFLQDVQASAYEEGFRLNLLLKGINPDNYDLRVEFKERRTETANQAADRSLKYQAMGASKETVFETAGINSTMERARLEAEINGDNPYPNPNNILPESSANKGQPKVSITPGNQRKGDSSTTIATRSGK